MLDLGTYLIIWCAINSIGTSIFGILLWLHFKVLNEVLEEKQGS